MRRWLKPVSWQSRRQWAASRQKGRKSQAGARRKVQKSRGQSRFLHRFYEPKTTEAPVEVQPEMVDKDLHLRMLELLQSAAVMRGPSFMTILESGIDDGLPYFVTDLNEGEFVQDYVLRRGALPTVTSLALVHQLLQDLGKAEEQGLLLSTLRMDQVLVTTQEEEYLQLRLYDYGLSQPRSEAFGQHSSRFVVEACRLLCLLMTGQTCLDGNPDDFSVIAELPASLRFVIKSVLTSPSAHSISRKSLRDEIREAMCSYVTLVQARNPKLLLVADPSTLPVSHLQTLLLGEIPLTTLIGTSFRIQNPESSGCYPFTISAVTASAEQPVTLHLLPPERIARQSDFMALPPQVWRQDPARQTNLLHLLGLWKGPDWAFLSEAREPGMSLSALMAKRGTLNPGEVITLLRQVHAGLEQAAETGVQRVDLDPANIQLCVGHDGPVLPRDLERLHQKRLDAWPKFVVKLRLHKTMRSLCKPRLIDLSPWAYDPDKKTAGIAARDEQHRTFVGLAVYLLTGEGQMQEIAGFPSSLPEMAAAYLHECLQKVLSGGTVPHPFDFTEKLSHLLTVASAEMDSIKDSFASQEITSAGFVSDFEEDQESANAPMDQARKNLLLAPVSGGLKSLDFHRPSPPQFKFPWLALAATVMLVGTLTWMIFGNLPEAGSGVITAAPVSLPQIAAPSQEEVAEITPKPPAPPPLQALSQPIVAKLPVLADERSSLPPAPPAAQLADVPMPMALKPEAPAMPPLENVSREEPPPSAKAVASPAQKPQLVASAPAVSSTPAPNVEPVIRRAILTSQENTRPTQPDLPPKEIAISPAPLPAPSTPEPVVAAAAPPAPPADVAALQGVTIRHAIVLTNEEINETLRAQTKARKRTTRRR
ncbi:hypothetical protein [Prosthecobacter sp.]|uniref:hypothetical protein n=1 Tax=Prosthecobacter sp. TaxID=1965333 RepID=UPI0037835BFB